MLLVLSLWQVIRETLLSQFARCHSILMPPKKEVWLICESPLQAQDNGFILYEWIRKNHPEINIYYVIDSLSPDAKKFNCELYRDNVLYAGTYKQYLYFYVAKKIISTHGLWMIPNEIGVLKKYNKKHFKAQGVMLNHGVTFQKNGADFYHKDRFPLNNKQISVSKKEQQIFVNYYGYTEQEVSITGFPRFDLLVDTSDNSYWPNMITFMPTFRDNEQNLTEAQFYKTALYKHLNAICSNEAFTQFLQQTNSHFVIYLHQNIQSHMRYLTPLETQNIKLVKQGQLSVAQLLRMSKLLVTDFSSVIFDFAYMKKPFVSFQFGYDSFVNARTNKPFIDLKKDLPGEVVDTSDALITTIMHYQANNYQVEERYLQQSKLYFDHQDRNNCQRTFDAIVSM